MIFRPAEIEKPQVTREPREVWQVVEKLQQPGSDCFLITQSDHARLAGEIAAYLNFEGIPRLDAEIIEGIKLHDHGWAEIESAQAAASQHPVSFLHTHPTDVVQAWLGSIERAQRAGPSAGVIVSQHFCRIGRVFGSNDASKAQALARFLEKEEERQAQLTEASGRSAEELALLTDVLQFCDLLSLYLCAGAQDFVVFPQHFAGRTITLAPAVTGFATRPVALREPRRFQVNGRRYRPQAAQAAENNVFTFELR